MATDPNHPRPARLCRAGLLAVFVASASGFDMTPSPMIERPESPCIDVCTLDAGAGFCTDCGRTLAEIGEWSEATVVRQHAIVSGLPERLATLAAGLPVLL